jgi:hypothetical protein
MLEGENVRQAFLQDVQLGAEGQRLQGNVTMVSSGRLGSSKRSI